LPYYWLQAAVCGLFMVPQPPILHGPHKDGNHAEERESFRVLGNLVTALKPYLVEYGYWAVFAVTLLENLGVPAPGQTVLITAAILASQGDMNIFSLILTGWAGAVIGGATSYALGRFGGRALILRYGHHVLLTQRRLEYVEGFFQRHGGVVVVVARFFEVLRQINGIVAGTARMPWWRFLIYNILGGALWVGFWGMLFYQLGERAKNFGVFFKKFEPWFLGGLVFIALGLVIYLLRRRK
jgi:membrane protein DedA with SNARE-associated domain